MEAADEDSEVEAEQEPPLNPQASQPVVLCNGVDSNHYTRTSIVLAHATLVEWLRYLWDLRMLRVGVQLTSVSHDSPGARGAELQPNPAAVPSVLDVGHVQEYCAVAIAST